MKKILITAAAFLLFAVSCEKDPITALQQNSVRTSDSSNPVREATAVDRVEPVMQMMSIYYNDLMYTARVKELTGQEAQNALANAQTIRTIYVAPTLQVHNGLSFWFYPVLDNIRHTTSYAIYVEKKINYDARITRPEQFTSVEDIMNAVLKPNSGASVTSTGKVVMITVFGRPDLNVQQ